MPEKKLILLAEDLEDDVILITKALQNARIPYPVQVVRDGEEVIEYLKGEGRFGNREEFPLPELVLLDLKMPKKGGFEVLQWMRQQPNLLTLRVVVLTSSDQIRDVNAAYSFGANSFLVKPFDFQNYLELGRFISEYWLKLNKSADATDLTQARPPETALSPAPSLRASVQSR